MSGMKVTVEKLHRVEMWRHTEIAEAKTTTCPLCFKDVVEHNPTGDIEIHAGCGSLFHSDCMKKLRTHSAAEAKKCSACGKPCGVLVPLNIFKRPA